MKPVDKISYITGKEKKGKKSYNDLTSEMSDVYEKLTNEAEEHKKTLKAIEERLKFEELISRLSARFINLPVNEIDREINNALLDIIKHLHMDRSYIYEYFKDENTFKMSYGYTSDGIPVIPSYMNEFYFPWVARQTLAGKTLFCSGIEDIPENEITDRENHLKFGIKNVLIFPMYIEGEVGAICSISTNKEDFSWSESFIKQITLVGQVLSSAIARKRNYEKNRILHEELYHIKKCITLGELSASLTHEINQPLCSIMTDAETCLHLVSSGDSNVSHILEDIISASKRANSIITSFRKMFKKEHHEFEPLNINELIKNSLSMLNSTMGMKEIKINVKDLPEPPDIMGDRIKIQQVIINLLLNGADSMANLPEKSREILIVTEMDDKDHIKVSLRDRGHGLNEIKKIFLPFYTQKSEGMGMGLFIAKNIIEEHNGKLWAENNHDRGSTFYFTIPVKKERENYPAVKKETGVSLVYIVDDDSMVRKSMVRLLNWKDSGLNLLPLPKTF